MADIPLDYPPPPPPGQETYLHFHRVEGGILLSTFGTSHFPCARAQCHGIHKDYKDYVVQNPKYMRPEELTYLKGDSSKTREILGWEPEYTFETLLDDMIDRWEKEL